MKTEQAASLYVGAFVDELARCGLRNVVACPGSRSTPLALVLASEPRIRLWMHLDERSAAFFALGMAKAGRTPVGLLCTSGTAAANFLPAIVEAHLACVPLVVLTADRPPELRDSGAPQTIDQIKMYGDYAKWFVEMALPEGTPGMLRYVRTIACRAAAEAQEEPAGVVHLNFPFREPLVPVPADVQMDDRDRAAYLGRPDGRPYARAVAARRTLGSAWADRLRAELAQTERGLIVVGPQSDPALAPAVARLSAALGYPILADPLSLVRCGPHMLDDVVDCYDAFLRVPALSASLNPQVVLRFGAPLTSKPVLQFLEHHLGCRQILVGAGWRDPTRLASDLIQADPVEFCDVICESGFKPDSTRSAITTWLAQWRDIQALARQVIAGHLAGLDEFFEGRVFSELAGCLPDGALLWASSSMPVRDLDTFYPRGPRQICFLANRGANGIDGVVSSALGAAAARPGPAALVIGDIAFFHDMNGLLAARQHALDLTIVLINNDGGGIFSFLPQAAHPEHFEQLFGTPHGLDFEAAAALYGASYCLPADWAGFRSAVSAGLGSPGLKIVEVRTDRARNVALHRALWPKVAEALETLRVSETLGASKTPKV
jgi:2-succinyl-5-enolpyruvyl-6-hydroxy-3-cyclohexene-1-carboxylate synthase